MDKKLYGQADYYYAVSRLILEGLVIITSAII